jgi:hypothetical protein
MTLKRKIWNFYVQLIRKRFCAIKSNHNYLPGKAPLCLVTIAFNSDFLIKEQIRLVKKHITDSHIHIVADNSSDNKKRKAIKALCEKENITYVNLPFNWFNRIDRRGSYSHGLAMAWVYCNIIKKVKPDVFGFIDHDIFPIKPYSLLQKIGNQDFYGRLIDRTPEHYPPPPQIWYLWAGFCFFNYDKVKDLKLNFMPCKVDGHYLDTAGGNYYPLYSKYNFE